MRSFFASFLVAVLCLVQANAARAQEDVVWVQIEAHPSLITAQERARAFAAVLPDVNGFSLGAGWYGIALGPYLRSDAERVLQVYRAEGQIPRDSYIAFSSTYREQFYPVGENLLNRGVIAPPENLAGQTEPEPEPAPQAQAAAEPEPQPEPADGTPAEARRSEAQLTRAEREELQIALRWAGYYEAAIDGAFGPGTRGSMAAWQAANGYETTGILTTLQRRVLLEQYNAPLTSVGLQTVTDREAGISIKMPMAEVAFEKYEPPFAHYDSTGDLGVRVLLISQRGDRATLFGLYDIMQTLEIVPLDGAGERRDSGFTLTGQNSRIVSHTEAELRNGQIKGFTLIWPVGDEARRTRVLEEMRASFETLPGALDPAAGGGTVQDIDLVAGLQVRRPRLSRSGFFADRSGVVVTTAEAVENCGRITLDEEYTATLLTRDPSSGIAVLRPETTLAPPAIGRLNVSMPRLQSDVAVAGYSFEGILTAPSITFGKLADAQGLQGEPEQRRLTMKTLPGDAGGPVLDTGGQVVGMLLPRPEGARQLPEDVALAVGTDVIRAALSRAGVQGVDGTGTASVTAAELNATATGMTVLVSCWD